MSSKLLSKLGGLSLTTCRYFSNSRPYLNEIIQDATVVTTTVSTTNTSSSSSSSSILFDQQIPNERKSNRFRQRFNGDRGNNDQASFSNRSRNYNKQVTENLSMSELNQTRIRPTLSTFYGGNPVHETIMNTINSLIRKYEKLPKRVLSDEELRAKKFIGFEVYKERLQSGTRLRPSHYRELVNGLSQLRTIEHELMPLEVIELLGEYYSTSAAKAVEKKKIQQLDQWGRSTTKAKRKNAEATVRMVRGEGQVIVNGINVIEYFPNVYARKNLAYPFQVVDQEGKYNIFATVTGGGYTGQSEAIMYAIAKGLVVFNPLLKSRLSKAGLMTSDTRVVERKKPGKLKARKSPTWVKR